MMFPRTRAPRRAFACVALLCMAIPAAAYLQRVSTYFGASFNVSSAPGSNLLPAEVGQFSVTSVPSEFSVAPGKGGGELKIDDNGTTVAATLEALFKKTFAGPELNVEWTVRASQIDARLVVSVQDAGDTGLIDCGMDDDGSVDVDGLDTGFVYQPDVDYEMHLNLKAPLLGSGKWTLDIESGDQLVSHSSGPFNPPFNFKAKSLTITRPPNDHAGKFHVDDILVWAYLPNAASF